MSFLTDSILILSKQKIEITIHINIFLPSGKGECYFEMGILAKNKNGVETSIEILLPIESDEFQFEDLSNRFINSAYLRLIFNQSSLIYEDEESKIKEFEIDNRKIIFGKIDDVSDNKIILNLGEDRTRDYYFRFRLKNIKKERLCLEKETTSFVIDPFKRFINVAGFHINNIRNDKNGQLDSIKNEIVINEINTFFICDITATLIDSSIPKQSFRLLEDNTWEKYISSNKNTIENTTKKIIYQFKKMNNKQEESIKDFKLFVKTSHIASKNKMYLIYFLILVVIGIIANISYDCLMKLYQFMIHYSGAQ